MESVSDPNGNEILWDGKTVWVNSGQDCSSIWRFSQFGIDVHVTATVQIETGQQCLDCSKDNSLEGWERFCESVRKHYQIRVPKEARPKYLDAQLPDRHCVSCGKSWNGKHGVFPCPFCLSRNVTKARSI